MQITTERLILREFVPSDWQAVLAYQSDARYLCYYAWTERTPAAVQAFIQMFLDHQKAQPRTKFQLAIVLKSSQQLIGNCGIRQNTADDHQAEIGYEIAPNHWGNGYATEAVRAIVAFGFTQLRLHRIWAECIADNLGSARVLQKLDLQPEGQLRENQYFKGRWWDTKIFAILAHEWQAHQSAEG